MFQAPPVLLEGWGGQGQSWESVGETGWEGKLRGWQGCTSLGWIWSLQVAMLAGPLGLTICRCETRRL